MNYRVDKFTVQDWYELEPREEVKATLEELKKEAIFKDSYTNGMPFFTVRVDDKIIAIYGMMDGGCGTYLPSILASKYISKYTKLIIKLFYEYFALYVPKSCRRMEAFCDIMDVKAIRLAKHFGFDVIGIRHNASAEGHDQVIMERLTTCHKAKIRR